MTNEADKKTEQVQGDYSALLFGVRRSVRYHMRRCRFFDLFHSTTSVVGVIAGSSAIFAVLSEHPKLTVAAGAIIAVASAIDLVVGTGAMARLHNDLAKKFIQLEKDIVLAGEPTEEIVRRFTGRRLEIEAEEPPVLRALDRLCHNELLRAMGYPTAEMVYIPRLHRLFAQFISFEPSRSTTVSSS